MSKKIKILASTLAIALLFALVSTITTHSPTYAYSGGLLNGLAINLGSDLDDTQSTVNQATDNNDTYPSSPSVTVQKAGTQNDTLWYKFSSPVNISSYKLICNDDTYFRVKFYDNSKNVLFDNAAVVNGNLTNTPINDVSYVALVNEGKNYDIKVFEFDVFSNMVSPAATAIATPTPDTSSGMHSILTITLDNGFEKEFDIPMSELNEFLSWYDSSSGSSRYGIDKHDNNKGPFFKRTEYVIHDKILTFEVSEYTATE
ncbi:hypothetical protein NYE24_06915 [Paenibacillus sp. FSL H7-0350]|uniref:hypothetical protein n=1 Tax=Paenibacillus sp. FSL H7-0350 TaxID=2975345 RepID=UPI003158CDFE